MRHQAQRLGRERELGRRAGAAADAAARPDEHAGREERRVAVIADLHEGRLRERSLVVDAEARVRGRRRRGCERRRRDQGCGEEAERRRGDGGKSAREHGGEVHRGSFGGMTITLRQ